LQAECPVFADSREDGAFLFSAQVFVALFDLFGFVWFEIAKNLEELGRFEGFKKVVGFGAVHHSRAGDEDDGDAGMESFDLPGEFVALDVFEAAVHDDAVNGWKAFEEVKCFGPGVGGKNVELGGFYDELPGGDAAGELAVDDKKAWPDHGGIKHESDL